MVTNFRPLYSNAAPVNLRCLTWLQANICNGFEFLQSLVEVSLNEATAGRPPAISVSPRKKNEYQIFTNSCGRLTTIISTYHHLECYTDVQTFEGKWGFLK